MDTECRALFRRFMAGDVALADRLLALIERGGIRAEERPRILAVVFGDRLVEALRKANEKRNARTVRAARVADQLCRGRVPTCLRGGSPPMKRREATGWKDPCLETVVRVDHHEGGVRVRASVVLYEGKDSVEVEVDTFTAETEAALLWGVQHGRATA